MLVSEKIIPTIGEAPTPLSFDSDLEPFCYLRVCLLAYRLGVKVYLNLTCHLGPNWFYTVYVIPLCYVILSKVVFCPLPSCFMLFSSAPLLGPQCCLYNLMEGQPENRWPLGGKYCIISNPSRYSALHPPCFLQHVQHQHLPVNPLGRATGTHTC